MKKHPIILICCFLLGFFTQACQLDKTYEINNPGSMDIIDQAIVLNRSTVNRFLTDTITNAVIGVRDENGEWLPSQCDDIDGDGIWDELAFICDLEAGEGKKVIFETLDTLPDFPIRTNIRFGRMVKPFEEVVDDARMKTNDTKFTAPVYQMEGPAWENDMIAFRNYYDARNGIDIFGKCTTSMVMDSVGVNGREYHTLSDWGMDILKVGNSLGAGAIAIGIGDSLYRVGPCEEGNYRLIAEGPVRSIFELTYKNVPAADRLYQVTHQISIYAADRFYRSKVWVNELRGDEELVTGIVNLHNVPAENFDEGNLKVLASLGNQGYSGEVLGMGILIPSGAFKRFWEAPETGSGIVSTHLVSLTLSNSAPTEYYFAAVWETRDSQVKEKAYFINLLKSAALKIK
jgi:hypothetical protein